jgi:L-fuconolactonase
MDILTIDSHQHFWKFDPVRDSWITEDMRVIQRDFFPSDLEPVLKENNVSGTVVIQSDQSESENHFQLGLAAENSFIKGVVGWVDLLSPDLEERLVYYRSFPKLKGFRHVLQGEKKRDLMLLPAFQRGIGLLSKYGFSYDLLIFPDQLRYAEKLVAAFPLQRFVIDHIAKPYIRTGDIEDWENDISKFSVYENVFCKISGLVTEADWTNWRKEEFRPYLDVIINTFGFSRIMFGSDWPACLPAAAYSEVKKIVSDYISSATTEQKTAFFSGNAIRFYQL